MVGALLLVAVSSLTASVAEGQRARPVTIVVPFAAGGGADFVAQRLAEALPGALKEPVVVSNRPGEDGLASAEAVLRAPPDGSTLLLASPASLVFAPLAHGRMPLDPLEDYEPVAVIASVPRIVLAHPSLEVRNLDQLIRLAREQPGRLPCGTADQFSQHAARLFERQAGVKLDCKHYPGASALRDDLLAGRIKLAFESAFLPEAQSGQLRPLAIAGTSRIRALPDVPTASEAGLPGFDAVSWLALVAPKGTDGARVEALATATQSVLRSPVFAQGLEARGYIVRPMTAAQMRTMFHREMQQWRRPN